MVRECRDEGANMKVQQNGLTYFSTRREALIAAERCMELISKARVWTKPWERSDVSYEFFNYPEDYLPEWEADDGLVFWKVSVELEKAGGIGLFSVNVTMDACDQRFYSYMIPSHGGPHSIIDDFLADREEDVEDGGELWWWLDNPALPHVRFYFPSI